MTPYKLKILNGVLKLKSFADVVLNIFGIKDLGTQTGNVSDGLVDWSIQHLTKTTAQWNADTTTILLKGQLGIEDTGNASYKVKIGNGTNLWGALSYVGGGAGGSQDLQSVTDLGAITTNAINTAGITSDYLQIDTTATPTNAVGKVVWNDSLGTGEIGLKGGTINAKLAQDLYARVVNKTTQNLLRANYQAVKVQSAQGQRLAVNFAQANNDLNSADTIGIVAENINNNQEGFVITVGQINGLDTTGTLQGETWTDGDVLYLSPTTAGSLTNVKPDGSTGHIVVIGYVEYSHQNNGKIYVKIMNGWELDELHNVYINQGTLANNDALIYESSTQLWKNKTIATVLGYTPAPLYSFELYADTSNVNPPDGSIYYSGALNNFAPETTNTIPFKSIKTNCIYDIYVTVFVRTTLGSTENSTVKLQNITQSTEQTLGTIKHSERISQLYFRTSLANNLNDSLIIQITNPNWVTNPISVLYSFNIKGY